METQSTIRLERVTKRFSLGPDGGFTAVEDVSLEVHPGEFVSVVGPSGCGKSTLLGMISGLLPPSPSCATQPRKRPSSITGPLMRQCFCGVRFENGVR